MAAASAVPDRLPLVRQELLKLRQGLGLAHPTAVLGLSQDLRRLLAKPADTATETVQIVTALTSAIENLDRHHRQYARVDFNLDDDHSYPLLQSVRNLLPNSCDARPRRCGATPTAHSKPSPCTCSRPTA